MNKTKTATADKVTYPLRLPPPMYKKIRAKVNAIKENDNYAYSINDFLTEIIENTYKLNELLHRHSIPEQLRSQFVGTCLLALKNGLDYSTPTLTAAQVRARIKEVLEDLLNNDINKAEKLALLNRNVLDNQYVRQLKIEAFREILTNIKEKILPFINDKSTSGQDLLNLFFVMFNKYVSTDKNQACKANFLLNSEFNMKMEKQGIAVVGTLLVDKINEISAYPNPGELTKILRTCKAVGGCAPNDCVDLKCMDNTLTVKAVGCVGVDENGAFLTKILKDYGIDTTGIKTCEEHTSFTEVMSIKGSQRTFFTYAGANSKFGLEDIDFETLNVKMLHLGYLLLLEKVDNGDGVKILKKAKENGIRTSIDLVSENSDRYQLVLPCLAYTDNLIINEIEAGKLSGKYPCQDKTPE